METIRRSLFEEALIKPLIEQINPASFVCFKYGDFK